MQAKLRKVTGINKTTDALTLARVCLVLGGGDDVHVGVHVLTQTLKVREVSPGWADLSSFKVGIL